MEIFLVSFLIFTGAVGILLLCQWARGSDLPVGCTPQSGGCCRDKDFGNCIERAEPGRGNVKGKGVEQWPGAAGSP